MTGRLIRVRIILFCTLFIFTGLVWLLLYLSEAKTDQYLRVSFLDVGQGDSIFIQTPSGNQVIIDGGPTSAVLRELSNEMDFLDRTIDILVGTHPDNDHIGGLVDVLDRYDVSAVLTTENRGDSSASNMYRRFIDREDAQIVQVKRGQLIKLGASTTLEVLFPEFDASNMESNASSIVLRLVYGDTSFLLTGDSPKRIERYLVLTEGEKLESDVLKVGHHGSKTSTSLLFIDEVRPEYAVISVGANNRYGHPNVEVTDTLFNAGVKVLSTAELGTITFVSDGEKLWVE